MKLGVYTAILHDLPLGEALAAVRALGLDGAEINAGGFLATPHLPVADILGSDAAAAEYLGEFERAGITLTGLNVNGNPLHPNPAVREKHAGDLLRSIELAARLGVRRIVTMSGLPGGEPGASRPNWAVNPWTTAMLDILDHQWQVAVPFWRQVDRKAADHDVKIAIEMHPHNIVYNPATLMRLVERTGASHVGAEMDPSHLFWQGIDPVAAIEYLGPLVFHAAAKDTRINAHCRIHGVLDDRFRRMAEAEHPLNIGGPDFVTGWPSDSSWDFVAVGRGHDVSFWQRFLAALEAVDPEMAVNIEHEDAELGKIEGLRVAAETLHRAMGARGASANTPG